MLRTLHYQLVVDNPIRASRSEGFEPEAGLYQAITEKPEEVRCDGMRFVPQPGVIAPETRYLPASLHKKLRSELAEKQKLHAKGEDGDSRFDARRTAHVLHLAKDRA